MTKIDVIIPVYDGYDDTVNCINSVLGSVPDNDTDFYVVIVNDCSPSQALSDWLAVNCRGANITLLINERNLGFVESVNRGMSLNTDRDVILLNSDTIVANDWVDRLVSNADLDKKIATITPFSNNATICSFPEFCVENEELDAPVLDLDACFSRLNKGVLVDVPTGVGFCMYIRRQCLNEIGVFDSEAFGLGYGEENDFCQRAEKRGWRNVHALDTYVAHVGGVSFSSKKEERVNNAIVKLEKMHPGYNQAVHDFIAEDPARAHRMRAYLYYLGCLDRQKILCVSHNLGGGVETHIAQLKECLEGRAVIFVLRKNEDTGGYEIEIPRVSLRLSFMIPAQLETLQWFLGRMGVSLIHFHHTMGIDPVLWGLAKAIDARMGYTIHDYYLVNSNPTLTGVDGRFCIDKKSRDEQCRERYPLPFDSSIEEWRAGARDFLDRCDFVISPSVASKQLFIEYFPECQVIAAYHPDSDSIDYSREIKQFGGRATLRIVALGALSMEKGADLFEAVAKLARSRGSNIELHLVGYAYRPLDESVICHGPYAHEDLPALLNTVGGDVVWLPAQWPETYSYTLSEAIELGVPIFVPNIGAFPERVTDVDGAYVYDWELGAEEMLDMFMSFAQGAALGKIKPEFSERCEALYYKKQYLTGLDVRKVEVEFDSLWLDGLLKVNSSGEVGRKEYLLKRLYCFRASRLGRLMSKAIPISLQRGVKRLLSRRPMHEIIK